MPSLQVSSIEEQDRVAQEHGFTVAVWQMPEHCPSCGTAVIKPDGYVDVFCPNDKGCLAQITARLRHATGKQALDIDGCGEVMVEELVKHGVRTLADVFSIQVLSFIKHAARKRFIEGREHAKAAPLWRKLHALGVDGIGRTLCQEIAARWPSLAAAFDETDELRKMIGEVNYATLCDYLKAHAAELDQLDVQGVRFETEPALIGPLHGKVFVITGALVSGSRETVAGRIEAAGGTVKSSVTKKVHFLVTGTEAGRTKTEAAEKHGTVCIDEKQLYEMLGQPLPVTTKMEADREY